MLRKLIWAALIAIFSTGVIASHAQEKKIVTLSVPQWNQEFYDEGYFAPFYQANPDVHVVLVVDSESKAYPVGASYASLEDHLEGVQDYVTSADVLMVTSWSVSLESTAAGLWLDLMPLVAADPDLAETNFYPPGWKGFQWNRGMWALPSTIDPLILAYDPAAFDAAGLTYPAANWTMNQYAETAIALTEYDASGNPVKIGCWCSLDLMLYGMLGHGLADAAGMPQIDDPQLAEMVAIWADARPKIYPQGGYSSEGVPLQMMGTWMLQSGMPGGSGLIPGELPGGIFGAQIAGFGISAATAHPDEAFRLAKFLAQNPLNSFGSIGTFPALRQSELSVPENYMVSSFHSLPAEQQHLISRALETGISGPALHYFDYVNATINRIQEESLDAQTALQQAQETALANYQAALAWTSPTILMVATPIPTPSFGTDEIALNFGISLWSLPNREDWMRAATAFAENDPQVGVVNINQQGSSYEAWQSENDCFYLEYDAIYPGAEPTDYLALDPLLDVDPAFNTNDLMPGALEALQSNGRTFGYPLSISISALAYTPEVFAEAGIPLPTMNWTINEFADALAQFKTTDAVIPFSPRSAENTDWLILIAAYGGLPIDYRTDPPTWNFTDPANVDAIRQALDLAKGGLSDYHQLGTFYFGGMQRPGAITAATLNGQNYGLPIQNPAFVNYPAGSSYSVMSVSSVGGGYIAIDTPHIDACYRWLSTIAAHPELLGQVMPARLSLIDDPVTLATQGESVVSLYREYAELALAPSTINIPGGFGSGFDMFFIQQFLNRAFDAYVLDGDDLEQALADAQTKADEFSACYAAIPPAGPGAREAESRAYADAIENCLALVDPEMAAERQALMQGAP